MTLFQLITGCLMIASLLQIMQFIRDRRKVSTYKVLVTQLLWVTIVGTHILFR